MPDPAIYHITRVPVTISAVSGLMPMTALMGVPEIRYSLRWHSLQKKSWRLGEALRQWGIRYYGSLWNGLAPILDEAQILRRLGRGPEPRIAHFLWGEFGTLKNIEPYHRRGVRVAVSVHCSALRWDSVWLRPDGFAQADRVVLTSESQRPFVARHVPAERICTILHGVTTEYFTPPAVREPRTERLRMLLLGNTERDHEFAAQIAAKLPASKFDWRIRTDAHDKKHYEGIAAVTLLPRLSNEQFLAEYQQADVLAMPMLDSAANNVFLESMACGTPVMTNCAGGVPEYIHPDCNFVLSNDRKVDEWVEKLLWLEQNRNLLERMRPATRSWAERFDWKIIVEDYLAMYRELGTLG